MSEPRITYAPRPDVTAETELSTLAVVYRIVLNANQRGRIPYKSGPDDGTKVKEDSANADYTRT